MRALIAHDDSSNQLLLQEILRRYGRSDVVANGRDAVEGVKAARESGKPYHVICLDIRMPEMDGHDALKNIRALEAELGSDRLYEAKIVIVTNLDATEHVVAAVEGSADAYLVKPIRKERLLEEVRRLGVID